VPDSGRSRGSHDIAQLESFRGQCAGIPVSFFEKRLK
jgi:hypothetical protein